MWKTAKLGELLEIARGGSPRPIKSFITDDDDGVNWIKIGDTVQGGKFIHSTKEKIKRTGISRSRYVSAGDFLLSNSMSFGRPYILQIDGCIHDGWLVLSNYGSHFIADYLYYLLSSSVIKNQFEIAARGSTVRNLNIELVANVEVSYPPLAEQKRIAAKLDAAVTEIDTMVKSSQLKQTEVKGLPAKFLKKILEDEAYDWTSERLSNIAVNLDAQRIPITKSKRTEGNIPYYGASGIVDYVSDFIFDEELLLISEDGANLLARTYPIAFSVEGKTWVNNHAHVLKFENKMLQKWVEYYLNSANIEMFISGMAQPKLNQKKLNEIPIPCPNPNFLPKLLSNFERVALQSDIILKLQTTKIEQLEKLKSAILADELNSETA